MPYIDQSLAEHLSDWIDAIEWHLATFKQEVCHMLPEGIRTVLDRVNQEFLQFIRYSSNPALHG